MRVYKAAQIPRSETQDTLIFRIPKNWFCFEKWVVGYLNYTILESYIW
jgi:hypothetical protein